MAQERIKPERTELQRIRTHGAQPSGYETAGSTHILTVNVEDYFQRASGVHVPARHWPRFAPRLEQNTLRVLDLLDRQKQQATFFTLGWIGDHHPDLVREIARRGHEIASKGYYHRALKEMSPQEFQADAARARHALEAATGVDVLGYRIARGWFGPKDL